MEEISTCAISGAVGTFANVNPKVELYVSKKFKLKPETVSTQIIPRDRHAHYFTVLGIIAGSIERIATEIRHLQRTEVYEVQEYFSKNQKGSSAMPHKNPILSENLTGLSNGKKLRDPHLKIFLYGMKETSPFIERNIGPDANITLDFALVRLSGLLENLVIYPNKMKNLELTRGLIFSQEVMLELTKKGMKREKAYRIIQKNAQNSFDQNKDFLKLLLSDKNLKNIISEKEIKKIFVFKKHFKNINHIFKRLYG